MSAAHAHATPQRRQQREYDDLALVLRARNGDTRSRDALIRRYQSFVRLKASSYFLAGGDSEDLQQEGLIGLYKAIRDYRVDKDTSFRSFAELCITRQIITAIKGATRFKHGPLNGYISFSHTPSGQDPASGDCTIGDPLAASSVHDCPSSSRRSSRCSWRATPTRSSASASAVTPRPSTTPSSASSARSARTSSRAADRLAPGTDAAPGGRSSSVEAPLDGRGAPVVDDSMPAGAGVSAALISPDRFLARIHVAYVTSEPTWCGASFGRWIASSGRRTSRSSTI